MNDQSTPKNDPDLFPPKIQEEETSATYEYTHEIQHNIVAMILADPKMTPLALKTIRPQYFDNPILQVLVTIMLSRDFPYDRSKPSDSSFLYWILLLLGNIFKNSSPGPVLFAFTGYDPGISLMQSAFFST